MQAHVDRRTGRDTMTPKKRREADERARQTPLRDFGPAPEQKGLDPATMAMVRTLIEAGKTGLEIAEHLGVHLRTARRYIATIKGLEWVGEDQPATLPPAPVDMREAVDRLFAAATRELAAVEASAPGAHSETIARITRALARIETIRAAMPMAADGTAARDHDAFRAELADRIQQLAADRPVILWIYPDGRAEPMTHGNDYVTLGTGLSVHAQEGDANLYSWSGEIVGYRHPDADPIRIDEERLKEIGPKPLAY